MKKITVIKYLFAGLSLAVFSFSSCRRVAAVSADTSVEKPTKDFAEPPHIDLINARWVLRELRTDAVKSEKDIYIRFIDQTTVEGFSGCNSFRGQYVSEGLNINIGPIAATKMACEQLSIEAKFLEVLDKSVSYYTDSKFLYLKDEEKVIAKLEAIYL